jgi:hypothetical protein
MQDGRDTQLLPLTSQGETAQKYTDLIAPFHKCRFAIVITHKNRSALTILFVLDAQSTEREDGSDTKYVKSKGAPNCMKYSSALRKAEKQWVP